MDEGPPKSGPPKRLIDTAAQKLLEWDARVVGEKRRGTIAIEVTYDDRGAVLIRELINLTTK